MISAGVIAAFEAAVYHRGEDAARELFSRVLRRPKRGRGKALAADRDARLLKAYDAVPEGESIASIARGLRAVGTQLGKRRARYHDPNPQAPVEARRWPMAMRNEPPTPGYGLWIAPAAPGRNGTLPLCSLGAISEVGDNCPHGRRCG